MNHPRHRLSLNSALVLIGALALGMPLAPLGGAEEPTQQPTAVKRYPPYPEVWDWVLEDKTAVEPGSFWAGLLDNGDVLILYLARKESSGTSSGQAEVRQITMFGKLKTVNESSNVRILREKHKSILLSDGSTTRIVKSTERKITFPDGLSVSGHSHIYRDCFRGPARYYITKDDASGKAPLSKVVFYLLEKPAEFLGGESGKCPEGPHMLRYKVRALDGWFLPLDDGTLLLVNSMGVILRFDRDMNTRSPLLNNKIFVFDHGLHDHFIFMNKVNGKDYGSVEEGNIAYQEALDDLYQHLMDMTKGVRTGKKGTG